MGERRATPVRAQHPHTMRTSTTPKKGLTRRELLVGASAGACVTALSATALSLVSCKDDDTKEAPQGEAPLVIEESEYVDLLSYDPRDPDAQLKHTFQLPLGSVVHITGERYGAVLMRSDNVHSLTHIGVFDLKEAALKTVLKKSHHDPKSFSLYDVRCSDEMIAWTEINYDSNEWVLFAAPLTTSELKEGIVQVDTGQADIIPPDFCVFKKRLIWQIMPNPNGDKKTLNSKAYAWDLGQQSGNEIWDSPGHFACAPLMSGGTLMLCPRVKKEGSAHYTVLALDPETFTTVNQMTMPSSVRPMSAVYFPEKNTFGIVVEANYRSGGLLGHMGSFIGSETEKFKACLKEPYTPIVSVGDRIAIKNRGSFLVFDTVDSTYFRLPLANNALDWGDFSATVGPSSQLMLYSTVKNQETGLPSKVLLRIFSFPQDKARQEAQEAGQVQKPAEAEGSGSEAVEGDTGVSTGGDAAQKAYEAEQLGVSGIVTGGTTYEGDVSEENTISLTDIAAPTQRTGGH